MKQGLTDSQRLGINCQYCNSITEVVDRRYGQVQECPKCTAYVSLNDETGKPKGCTANNELRKERRALHLVTDKLIQRKMNRDKVSRESAQRKLYDYCEIILELNFNLDSIAQLTIEENISLKAKLKTL